jgi:tetratricopeptide (TPR) repeat protein
MCDVNKDNCLATFIGEFNFRRGLDFLKINEFTNAINSFDTVLFYNPTAENAYYYRAMAKDKLGDIVKTDPGDLYTAANYWEQAINEYAEAIEIEPRYY